MLNNVAFAGLHLCVIGSGMSWALRPRFLDRFARRGLPAGDGRWQTADGRPSDDNPDALRELVPAP